MVMAKINYTSSLLFRCMLSSNSKFYYNLLFRLSVILKTVYFYESTKLSTSFLSDNLSVAYLFSFVL